MQAKTWQTWLNHQMITRKGWERVQGPSASPVEGQLRQCRAVPYHQLQLFHLYKWGPKPGHKSFSSIAGAACWDKFAWIPKMNMMKYELMQLAHMDFMNLIFAYLCRKCQTSRIHSWHLITGSLGAWKMLWNLSETWEIEVVPARSLSPLRSEPSHASYPPPASPVWVNRFPTPVPRHKVQPPPSPETVGRQTQSLQPELTHGIPAQYSTPVHPSHSQVSPIQYHRLLPRESSYTPQVRSISPQRSPQPHSQPQASFSASRVPRPVQLPSQPQPLLQEQVQQSSSDYLTQTASIPLPISCGSNGHTIPEELPTHSNRTLPIPRQTLHSNESNTEKEQMAEMLGTLWRRTSAFAEECSRWNHALQERQKEAADLADMLHTLSKQFADSLPQENDHTHEPHEPLTSTSETTAATAAAIEQAIGLIMPSPAHLGRSRLVDHETAETEAHEAVSDFQDFQASLPSVHSTHSIRSIHSPQAAFAQRDHSPQALLAQRDDGCENMPSVQGMTEISTMQGMDILAAQICEEEMSLEESAEYLRSVAMRLDAPGTQAEMTYEATSVIPGEDGKLAPEAYVGIELSPDPEEGELFAKVRSALSRVVGDSAAESLTDPAPTVIPGAWEERGTSSTRSCITSNCFRIFSNPRWTWPILVLRVSMGTYWGWLWRYGSSHCFWGRKCWNATDQRDTLDGGPTDISRSIPHCATCATRGAHSHCSGWDRSPSPAVATVAGHLLPSSCGAATGAEG